MRTYTVSLRLDEFILIVACILTAVAFVPHARFVFQVASLISLIVSLFLWWRGVRLFLRVYLKEDDK